MDEKRKEEEVRELTPEEIDDMILAEQIASGEHNEKVPEYYFSNPDPYAKVEPRTDSNHCRRYPENYCFLRCRLPNECRSLSPQSRFDRRFESSPESRGSQTSISLKHGRLAHIRSQFSLFRRSPTHKNLPPATFCTSEHAFWLLFARCKK